MYLNYYPTPRPLAEVLLSKLVYRPGQEWLETSAGTGHLADVVREYHPGVNLRCVELYWPYCQILRRKGYHGTRTDFLKYWRPVDVVIGNPPFCNNFQDTDHFRHAWELLRPGGQIAMLLHEFSAFPRYNTGKPRAFVRFLETIGAHKALNPPGAFLQSARPTATSSCIVWAVKS